MPPIVSSIIAIIQLAANAGPAAKELYAEARKLIDWLFKGGLISVAQQESLMSWSNAHEAATLAGEIPPALQVEADPA